MNNTFIGIDVGGTTVKFGIINENGNILDKWEIPTNTDNEGESILSDIWKSIEGRVSLHDVAGVGIGVPGFIDQKTGDVYEAVNIGWKQVELAKIMKEKTGLPVFVENDANAAVLGENWKGAGGQVKNLVAITVGTGIGGGIIANGSILNGESGTAGEIGHITMDPHGSPCNCGRQGCLETISSATGMIRQATEKIHEYPASPLAEVYARQNNLTAKDIFELAEKGDTICREIIQHAAEVLGLALANLAVIINPSRILIGGGVSQAGNSFVKQIDDAFRRNTLAKAGEVCEMKIAQLGNDAGIIGAAFLVKQNLEKVTF
ncbi:ROK family glucokinase [Virgibacillus siamensis]|uniref:ROK family glucokinase n=1 Tax=Virgibacillus siamensis TaxID=480071 RepID=UPI00098502E7|nr:ROK family glucokinase [Virgibacillus siamensis]